MDEEITIIDEKTRNEKIKNFLVKNKKLLISLVIFLLIIVLSFYSYQIYKSGHRENISNKYNSAVIDYDKNNQSKTIASMKEVIMEKDSTYSPLALYFLIDNSLISERKEINRLFDILISKTSLEAEIKYLIIYKKALFNADEADELTLLKILNPIINSDSVWKSHALYLLAEYFFDKNQKQKAKEFYNQILDNKKSNENILLETKKRLSRDFSE